MTIVLILGADLWVLVIGEGAKNHVTLRPDVKYVANMHGNEVRMGGGGAIYMPISTEGSILIIVLIYV